MCECFQDAGQSKKPYAETLIAMAVTKKQVNHSTEQDVLTSCALSSIYLAFHLTPLTHFTHPSTTCAFSSSASTPPSLINSTV
jgi:hypothetical protein